MAIDAAFYAGKVAEFGSDVKTMAEAFDAAIRRGDIDGARHYLKRLEHQAWLATDHAKTALGEST